MIGKVLDMRILILRHIEKNSMDDIYDTTDYLKYEYIKSTNVGNKLWLLGFVSTISTPNNQIDFLESYMDVDYINANYDICIKPEANIFSSRFIDGMKSHVEKYKNVKIPIYVIACGASAKSYDELDELCQAIKEPATEFIKSVYKTGGEFCLRGYFTKEMFDRFGFHDAVVTGCPSLYQRGRNLNIADKKVTRDEFKPALNGSIDLVKRPLKDYKKSEFFDQGLFYPILYQGYEGEIKKYIDIYGLKSVNLIDEDRLNLLIDMQDWANYLIGNDFNFSCGSRIHGNIMPILCGIPAVISPPDSRVREMAEFFDIPMITKSSIIEEDLYEIYLDTNYEKFNQSFAKKYDAYEAFLKERGIVEKLNNNSLLQTSASEIDFERLGYIQAVKCKNENREILERISSKHLLWEVYEKKRRSIIKAVEKTNLFKK